MQPLESLPFPPTSHDGGASSDPDPSGVRRQRRLHILVADDEPLVGAALKRALAAHEVTVVASGAAAVAAIQDDGPFDLVICDVMMPDLSGPRVYEAVQKDHPELASRFVFITGGVLHEASRRFLATMRGQVLQKPFDLAAVRDLVRSAIEREEAQAK